MKNIIFFWLFTTLVFPAMGEANLKLTPQETFLNRRYKPKKDAQKPTISIIIMDVGISEISEKALAELPPITGLAVSPFAKLTPSLFEKINNKNFPVLVQLPWSQGSKFSTDAHRYYNLKALKNLIARLPKAKGIIYSAATYIPYPSFEILTKAMTEESKSLDFEIWMPEPPLRSNLLDLTVKYTKRGSLGDIFIRAGDLNYIAERKLKEALDLAEKTGFATLCVSLPNANALKRLMNWLTSIQDKVNLVSFMDHATNIQEMLVSEIENPESGLEK